MQNAKSIIFFFSEILFRAIPSHAANRSRAKQPAVVSRTPIPAPNSRAIPIVSCAVRRSCSQDRSQYRSPVPLVPFHVPVRRLLAISLPPPVHRQGRSLPSVRRQGVLLCAASSKRAREAGERGRAMLLLSREVVAARRETA